MIRLTWRQFRTPAAVAALALLAVAVVAAVTWPDLSRAEQAMVSVCRRGGDCRAATAALARSRGALVNGFGTLVTLAPALAGAFWGAPLVAREVEVGTLPLVWTQSVTRTRWMLVKLAVLGTASVAVTGLLSLVVTWWTAPLDAAAATRYATFAQRDVVPVGYALFAFALGVATGVLLRRAVPAMAVTLAAFTAVRVCTTFGLRPRLLAPEHRVLALDPASTGLGEAISPSIIVDSWFNGGKTSALDPATPVMPDTWIRSTRVVDAHGHDLTDAVLNATCPTVVRGGGGGGAPAAPGHVPVPEAAQHAFQSCVSRIGATYHELVTYLPARHYWALQLAELGVYLGAAMLLGALTVWWVRRRS